MAGSKIAVGLEKLVNSSGKQVGKLQAGANKILWGSANTQPTATIQFIPASGSSTSTLNYTAQAPTTPKTPQQSQSKFKTFAQSGLFNILNALNSVDLCNVLTYAYDNINLKKKPRPEKPWNTSQTIFYGLQDGCKEVVKYIDKYTAYPNVFIGSYLGVGPNAVPPVIAAEDNNAPVQGGTEVQKYNTYFLMQAIKETFTIGGSTGSLFTSEDVQTIQAVPGLVSNINFIKDFLGSVDEYTDYKQIPDVKLQAIITNINKIRSACVTIQNLDFRDPKGLLNLAGNYLGFDVRNQIQQLSKYIDVTKIIPTLKQVNDALRSFIRICNQVQKIITLAQFVIKLGILFYKVFKFIIKFFSALPAPSMFLTAGIQTTIQDAKDAAKAETDGVMRILRALNALLAVVSSFVKYLLANTVELLTRLESLLVVLRGCEAMEDSDVLYELEETNKALRAVKEQLEIYVLNFEGKTNPNTAEFGAYQIRVEDEEVVETTIRNKRRRGIALDMNGRIVTQSDLTFATNQAIIIQEVKQKLVSLGLVNPTLANINTADVEVISESLTYLENNDILDNDLNITEPELDSGDNLDENKGLGLQAFINNLKGGRRLRRRMRESLAKQKRELATQIKSTDTTGRFTSTTNSLNRQATQDQIRVLQDKISEWRKEIAIALTQGPAGYIIVKDRNDKIKQANIQIKQLQQQG